MVKQKDKDDEPRVLECAWGAGEMMLFSRQALLEESWGVEVFPKETDKLKGGKKSSDVYGSHPKVPLKESTMSPLPKFKKYEV